MENQKIIVPSMLNNIFDKKIVQSLFSSLHKSYKVKTKIRTISLVKSDKRNFVYTNSNHKCIHANLDEALLEMTILSKVKDRFQQSRLNWLYILEFTSKNFTKIVETQKLIHLDPSSERGMELLSSLRELSLNQKIEIAS